MLETLLRSRNNFISKRGMIFALLEQERQTRQLQHIFCVTSYVTDVQSTTEHTERASDTELGARKDFEEGLHLS